MRANIIVIPSKRDKLRRLNKSLFNSDESLTKFNTVLRIIRWDYSDRRLNITISFRFQLEPLLI